mgnify:CR=1 FL=1
MQTFTLQQALVTAQSALSAQTPALEVYRRAVNARRNLATASTDSAEVMESANA